MQQRTEIIPNARAIARARVEAGYSKLDIARAAGIPNSSVIRAERGQGVSAKTAAGICKALGRKLDDLFTVNCPGSAADQAREGLNRGIELILYVLIDKHAAPMDEVQQLARELNHAAECVTQGYIAWSDIRQMLKEYDVEAELT